jgi:hypothetical protein
LNITAVTFAAAFLINFAITVLFFIIREYTNWIWIKPDPF